METFLEGQQQIFDRIIEGAPLAEVLEALLRLVERQVDGLLGSILLLDRTAGRLRYGAAPRLTADDNAAIDGVAIERWRIVAERADLLARDVTLASAPGAGTTVTVRLPLCV